MLYSMTAFACVEKQTQWGTIAWDIKSLNHRYLEQYIRTPEAFRSLELVMRDCVRSKLKRGKVECTLRFLPSTESPQQVTLNKPLVDALLAASEEVQTLLGNDTTLKTYDILRWPGCVEISQALSEELNHQVIALLEEALAQLSAVRAKEGALLAQFIAERLDKLTTQWQQAKELTKDMLQQNRDKLHKRFEEMQIEADNNRIEQEIALLVQRMDVTEELDRIEAHTQEVQRIINTDDVAGRRLDFLMQEFNREANTLASKSNTKALTACAVEMKVLIEQMREQVQNIE